jgi:prepilin-type N-terminal cleavage/methylation domain-containing protein/prepilin-type processing-associated H-X9-DG protein
MRPGVTTGRGRGFTLVELLTVVGLIAVLVSLFMPVLSKVRAAAETTSCTSNLRQIGAAWTAYLAENRGRLPDYVWHTPATPDLSYYGYWTGIVDRNGVRGQSLLCPAARTESDRPVGFGMVAVAWSGRLMGDGSNGTAVRLDDRTYRVSSYGYNRHLTAGGGFGKGGGAAYLSAVNGLSNVPAFFDCAAPDARPLNHSDRPAATAPPNLSGDQLRENSPQHWRFLLGRHGRGINVYMADGSARWVRLDDAMQLTWSGDWKPYRLDLPLK